MVAEESVLRGGLLAGLLKALRHNSGHRLPWVRLFEMGDVFALSGAPDGDPAQSLPDEHERIALMLAWEDDDAGAAMNAWRVVGDALGDRRRGG